MINNITDFGDKEVMMAFKIESSLLDACALAILSRGDTYGYEITQSMKQAIVVSESTLYPVLRRLQKEKLCETYDEPYQGRNRRYYTITQEGVEKLEEYKTQWIEYKTAIDTFLGNSVYEEEQIQSEEETQPDEERNSEPAENELTEQEAEKEDGGGDNE
ncbi:MAG: PadR family transcriptional regulator [Anaerovoracaceae bacterium]